jgi:hypothetical protein
MCDMSGEYAGHGGTGKCSVSRNCVQILATWGCALIFWNMRWWRGMNGPQDLVTVPLHAVCHQFSTVETGILPWRAHFSSMPVAIEGEHFLPTEVGYDAKLQSGQDPGEDDEHTDELPWDGFWQLVQKLLGCANPQFHQLSGWLASEDPAGEEAGCGGPGLVW